MITSALLVGLEIFVCLFICFILFLHLACHYLDPIIFCLLNLSVLSPMPLLRKGRREEGTEIRRERRNEGKKKRKRETDWVVVSCLLGLTHHNYLTVHSLLICSQDFCQHIQFSIFNAYYVFIQFLSVYQYILIHVL